MRPIDKDKLLEWLKEQHSSQETNRDKLPIDHLYWEFHEGASSYLNVVIKAINTGRFDI